MCRPSFNFVWLSVSEKRKMKFFYIWKLERKKNEEIKGRISMRNLVLFHIKQQMIHNTCTKLQNPTYNSSWEIFVTNFPMYYIGVRDGKKEKWKKKANLNHRILVFFPTIYLAPLKVYTKFEDSGLIGAENSVTKSFIGEKENRTNKGNDKQQHADSLLHNTTSHTQHLYQISKSSAQ